MPIDTEIGSKDLELADLKTTELSLSGPLYRHHKGGLYVLLHGAIDATTGRKGTEVVVYLQVATGKYFVRDAKEFFSGGYEPIEGT